MHTALPARSTTEMPETEPSLHAAAATPSATPPAAVPATALMAPPAVVPAEIPAAAPVAATVQSMDPATTPAASPALAQDSLADAPSEATTAADDPLVCVGIDDSPGLRMMHQVIFEHLLSANMQRSCSLGVDFDEQTSFVDVVLGQRDIQLRPANMTHASIALLDQNIDLDGRPHLLGTELARQLADRGFSGVTCILTSSSQVRPIICCILPVCLDALPYR